MSYKAGKRTIIWICWVRCKNRTKRLVNWKYNTNRVCRILEEHCLVNRNRVREWLAVMCKLATIVHQSGNSSAYSTSCRCIEIVQFIVRRKQQKRRSVSVRFEIVVMSRKWRTTASRATDRRKGKYYPVRILRACGSSNIIEELPWKNTLYSYW